VFIFFKYNPPLLKITPPSPRAEVNKTQNF